MSSIKLMCEIKSWLSNSHDDDFTLILFKMKSAREACFKTFKAGRLSNIVLKLIDSLHKNFIIVI